VHLWVCEEDVLHAETAWSASWDERRKERIAHLDEMPSDLRENRNEDVLRYFAEPGVVDACHARREPHFASGKEGSSCSKHQSVNFASWETKCLP